jgi:succinate dehydrogenase/fumarate reductase cytochrome b subunit
MLRDYVRLLIDLVHQADRVMSPFGYVAAIVIAALFLLAAILLAARLLALLKPRTLIARAIAIVIGLPLAVVAALLVWRLFYHAARHLADSPWPWSLIF